MYEMAAKVYETERHDNFQQFYLKKAIIAPDDSSFDSVAVVGFLRFVDHPPRLDRMSMPFDLLHSCGPAVCKNEIFFCNSQFLLSHCSHNC